MLEYLLLNILTFDRRKYIMPKCDVCGKGPQFGNKISHSHRVTKRMWHPNIQKIKVNVDNTVKRINVCAKCLKAGKVNKSS